MYKLYTSPLSQHGRRVVSLLEQNRIPYQVQHVAIEQGEHLKPEFTAINPNNQLPALEVDGTVLIESHAIMRFLCDTHGLDDWYPKDTAKRALVDRWLDWNHYSLGPWVTVLVINKVMLGPNGDASAVALAEGALDRAFPFLESHLGDGPFVVGGKPTIADLAIASNVFQLNFANAAPVSKNINAWMERLNTLEGFLASLPSEQKH